MKIKIGNLAPNYHSEKDATFCVICVNATRMNLISSKNADKTIISKAFINWLDAGTKGLGLDKLFWSEGHKEAHKHLYMIPDICGGISAKLSTAFDSKRSINRRNLLKILSNVRFLARQAIPLRGRRSGKDSNFTQLYILREEDSKGLKTRRTEKNPTNRCTGQYEIR